jgi:hypothetical protein
MAQWYDDPRRLLRETELEIAAGGPADDESTEAAMLRHAVLFVAAESRDLRVLLIEQLKHVRTDLGVPLEAIAESVAELAKRPDAPAQSAPPLPATVELDAARTLLLSCPEATLRAETSTEGARLVIDGVLERVGFVSLRATLTHDQADRLVWLLGQRPPADH